MGPGFLINLVRKTDMWFGIIEESHLGQWALTSKTNLDIMNWINCITLQPAKKMYYPVLVEDIQSLKCVQCSEHIMRQNFHSKNTISIQNLFIICAHFSIFDYFCEDMPNLQN